VGRMSSAWPLRFQRVNDHDHDQDERRLSPRCRVSERNGGKETKTRNPLSGNLHNTPSSVAASDVEGISQRRDARKSQQLEHERYGDGGSRGTWLKLPSARFGLRACPAKHQTQRHF